jgi:hypothetical protein
MFDSSSGLSGRIEAMAFRRRERNVLINQEHPDFAQIRASHPMPVRWDVRLWKRR